MALLSRGVRLASDGDAPTSDARTEEEEEEEEEEKETFMTNLSAGPCVFRHDPRLQLPSHSYLSLEQIHAFTDEVKARTLLVSGEQGWPVPPEDYVERKRILTSKGLLRHITLPGSHHLHLDPEHAPRTASEVTDFLLMPSGPGEAAEAERVAPPPALKSSMPPLFPS